MSAVEQLTDRALTFLHLEAPAPVADDVARIVHAERAVTEALLAAMTAVARMLRVGWELNTDTGVWEDSGTTPGIIARAATPAEIAAYESLTKEK